MRLSRSVLFLILVFATSGLAMGHNGSLTMSIVKTPTDGGIKENFPFRFKARFEKWKAELLATDIGREQWEKFANNKQFVLTIEIADSRGRGAGTDKFEWDDKGNFVGATIMLGSAIEDGFPDPVYYPVLNSLASEPAQYLISGKIVAATKIAHELGHVDHIATSDISVVQMQNKLMPVYNSIFLKNGLKTADQRLIDIEKQMGGTPVEIWESREYWSEVNAMVFLRERISGEAFYCSVFKKIKNNVDSYARDYGKRFSERTEFVDMPCWK
ncbi:MAG: hypothetical protein ABL952_01245 [Pyrinomonadaceae bacterium]